MTAHQSEVPDSTSRNTYAHPQGDPKGSRPSGGWRRATIFALHQWTGNGIVEDKGYSQQGLLIDSSI